MPADETRIYDRAEAVARLDGDVSLFAEMADMFIAECDAYCRGLETALAAQDAATLRREAHTLKSVLATFSCETGRALAQQLEQQAAGGCLEGAEALSRQVIVAARALAVALAADR